MGSQSQHRGRYRLRQRATILYADVRNDIRMILEHIVSLSARVNDLARR